MAEQPNSETTKRPKDAMPVTLVDPTKFARLKRYSVLSYSPGKPDAAQLIVWMQADTLLEAVTLFNTLTPYEQKLAYVMKNVTWKTTVEEVDD